MFQHEFVKDIPLTTEQIDGKRYYLTPEGNKYPSITTALSHMSKDAILKWRKRVGEEQANKISNAASSRGTKVHLIAEKYVLNDPDYLKDVNPVHADMFKPIKDYLDEHCDLVYGTEVGMYSDTLRLAGRCDLICRLDGKPCIVDFKTASKPKEEKWISNYFMQCAAYSQMAYERHGIMAKRICILIATEHDGLQVFYKRTSEYYGDLVSYLDNNRVAIYGRE
jgi:hypothetical protein